MGGDDEVAITRAVSDALVTAFERMLARGVERAAAQREILVRALVGFAGSLGLGGEEGIGEGVAIAWTEVEEEALRGAAGMDWSRVSPRIFGALFQASLERGQRHALGAHFTSDEDIARVLLPTIVRPWRERIGGATGRDELLALWEELAGFRVLDPACGSGDFLVAAYHALVELERELMARLGVAGASRVSVRRCFGIDRDPFAAALARLTLWVGERRVRPDSRLLPGELVENFLVEDALFAVWPPADVIVGNPPFQAKNKMQAEFGAAYVRRLRERHPQVPGRADYCVYWFRLAHEALAPGGRAGLVGTNTICQNESRIGGLDPIVATGTIVEAVASRVWSGAAAVNVAIVSWIKQRGVAGPKTLMWQAGDLRESPWESVVLEHIGASLSPGLELAGARRLLVNSAAGVCSQGQTHGHAGFLLAADEARALLVEDKAAAALFPLLVGEDLLGRRDGSPRRYVIDFGECDEASARSYVRLFKRVEARVLPDRRAALAAEEARNGGVAGGRVNRHHAHFHRHWWRLSWRRAELLAALRGLPRYVVCARVSRRPVFEFVDGGVRPGDSLVVFALADDYSFSVLQSSAHWRWWQGRCSTLKRDCRYTSRTVFDSFPWPQAVDGALALRIAAAGRELRAVRRRLGQALGLTRRGMSRAQAEPRMAELQAAQAELDAAVRAAYGLGEAELLAGLLALNLRLAEAEGRGERVVGPGLAALELGVEIERRCVSDDRIGGRVEA